MSPLNLARLAPLLAALLLAACGGGGGTSDPPAPVAPVARVEILSTSAWLAGAGQTRELAAQAFDAGGNPVDAAITWSSSRPATVAVDANGRLTAAVAAGSAQISAQAGGITSMPILAFVAAPAAGVIVVDDSAIVGDPVDTDPSAAASLTNTYQVTLTGVAPVVGNLLLGSGDKSLAGRVTAVYAMGTQTRVTLQLVPIDELFASLHIEEVFDLSRAEVLVPPEVAAEFNVARSGNTWSFTPRPQPAGLERKRPLNVTASREIRPFGTCDVTVFGPGDIRNLLIGVEQPSFSITVSPALDLHYDRLSGLTRFVVGAEPLVKLGATLRISMPLKGEIKCSRNLFEFRLPIGGPLAFFFGGTVPVGVGFKLEGEAAPTTFKFGGQTEIGTKLSVGWNCPGPECEFVHSMEDVSALFTPAFDPLDPIQFARLSSKLHLFGSMDVELGNPFLRALRFKGLEFKLGPELEGNFAPPFEQLRDAAYMSDYSSMIKGGVKLGLNIDAVLAQLGLTGRLRLSVLDFERELANSPKALKIEADRATFDTGDTVNVKVRLDPATLTFLPGLYNVESVQLRRGVSGLTEVLATQTASPGQEVFDFNVSAPHAGDVSEWTAFVTTRVLNFELASLEVGRAAVSGLEVLMLWGGPGAVAYCSAEAYEIGGTRPRAMEETVTKPQGEANPATCLAQAWDAKAEASAVSSASGPTQDRSATPTPVTSLSSEGSAAASATSTPNIYIETPPHVRRAGGTANGVAGGEWHLLVQGQAVTMTITGSLSGYALFEASWAPSSNGAGVVGSYARNPVRGETGMMSHSVRLEPGQQVHIKYSASATVSSPDAPPSAIPQPGPSATASFGIAFTP